MKWIQNSTIRMTMFLQMKKALCRPMYRFCMIASPISSTFLLYEMFKNSGMDNFASYIILGAGLSAMWGCICFSSAGDIDRERYEGTLSLIFASPTEFDYIITGKILGNTLLATSTFLITILTAKVCLRVNCEIRELGLFLGAFLMTIVSIQLVSKAIAYLFTISRKASLYMNCIDIPFALVCGFTLPYEQLPMGLQRIGDIFPMTWAIRGLRLSMNGGNREEYVTYILVALLLCIGFYFASQILVRKMEKAVRIQASLEVS